MNKHEARQTPTSQSGITPAAHSDQEETGISGTEAQMTDKIEDSLSACSNGAKEQVVRSRRRMNAYLFLGVAFGFIGLIVWCASLNSLAGKQKWELVASVAPRVTILIFVEVIAGFFLRQYRIGVEDYKYFLNVERIAEAEHTAYLILKEHDDQEHLMAFANHFLKVADAGTLAGQASSALEASKVEKNPALEAAQVAGEIFRIAGK